MTFHNSGVLIVGSGISGLSAALRLAEKNIYSTILSKRPSLDTSSAWAQGGVAAVMSDDDSFDQHLHDTEVASAGTIDRSIAMKVISNGPSVISWLNEMGVPFEKKSKGKFSLGREGGHSKRRIVHVKDATGRFIMEVLYRKAVESKYISFADELIVYELLTKDVSGSLELVGVKAYDRAHKKSLEIKCTHVCLATGGHAGLYRMATSPAKGSGLGLAIEAGCIVENLQYVQFHPTALYKKNGVLQLITEALRGEGALLRDLKGRSFMADYHELGELAPRDIVSRSIFEVMKKQETPYLYLDATHLSESELIQRFPNIYSICEASKINMTKKWMPITPAAHYTCGGIKIDEHGRTNVKGIFAIGECSSSGLHGANRLASNSLLESLVFAIFVTDQIESDSFYELSITEKHLKEVPLPMKKIEKIVIECQELMWRKVGIVRTNEGLEQALEKIQQIQDEVALIKDNFEEFIQINRLEQRLLVCKEIVRAARGCSKNLGTHFNLDN